MANAVTGNKIYIDSTGTLTTKRTLVAYILFTPSVASDEMTLKETSAGSTCLSVSGSTTKETKILDFSARPLVFNNGIYVSAISSGANATLITTQGGD